MFALCLAALWSAVTSHALLEQANFIHPVHEDHHHAHHHDPAGGSPEHNADEHDFADGGYWAKTSPTKTPRPNVALLYETAWLAAVFTHAALLHEPAYFGPAPPGTLRPELLHRWNFLLRTAIDARAPSFLS
jgi:hypothetical protein